jgi:hypothetical protein
MFVTDTFFFEKRHNLHNDTFAAYVLRVVCSVDSVLSTRVLFGRSAFCGAGRYGTNLPHYVQPVLAKVGPRGLAPVGCSRLLVGDPQLHRVDPFYGRVLFDDTDLRVWLALCVLLVRPLQNQGRQIPQRDAHHRAVAVCRFVGLLVCDVVAIKRKVVAIKKGIQTQQYQAQPTTRPLLCQSLSFRASTS